MGKVFDRTPCPDCPYQAFSDADLGAHTAHAHPSGVVAEPFVVQALPPVVEEPSPQAEPVSVVESPPVHPALSVPQADDTFWVSDKTVRLLHAVGRISQRGEVVNVLLVGPKGTGKTSLPKEFAATQGRPFFTMHCQLVAERDDWWGSKELSLEKGTYFDKAAFLDAVEMPGCVILLDEVNRTHPENLNALFGLLDHRRSAWVPLLKREVVVAEGVTFFMTLNEGYEYVGTNPLDEALRDRMSFAIPMGYPPKRVEKNILMRRTGLPEETADKLAELAKVVRRDTKLGVTISTRQLLSASSLIQEGMASHDAVLFAVVNGAGQDVDRKGLLQALQMLGKVEDGFAAEDDDDEFDQPVGGVSP